MGPGVALRLLLLHEPWPCTHLQCSSAPCGNCLPAMCQAPTHPPTRGNPPEATHVPSSVAAKLKNSRNLTGLKARGASQPGKLGRKMRAVICGWAEAVAGAVAGAAVRQASICAAWAHYGRFRVSWGEVRTFRIVPTCLLVESKAEQAEAVADQELNVLQAAALPPAAAAAAAPLLTPHVLPPPLPLPLLLLLLLLLPLHAQCFPAAALQAVQCYGRCCVAAS